MYVNIHHTMYIDNGTVEISVSDIINLSILRFTQQLGPCSPLKEIFLVREKNFLLLVRTFLKRLYRLPWFQKKLFAYFTFHSKLDKVALDEPIMFEKSTMLSIIKSYNYFQGESLPSIKIVENIGSTQEHFLLTNIKINRQTKATQWLI